MGQRNSCKTSFGVHLTKCLSCHRDCSPPLVSRTTPLPSASASSAAVGSGLVLETRFGITKVSVKNKHSDFMHVWCRDFGFFPIFSLFHANTEMLGETL